eukprot:4219069-Pyramimonas_sp.AAC.1
MRPRQRDRIIARRALGRSIQQRAQAAGAIRAFRCARRSRIIDARCNARAFHDIVRFSCRPC